MLHGSRLLHVVRGHVCYMGHVYYRLCVVTCVTWVTSITGCAWSRVLDEASRVLQVVRGGARRHQHSVDTHHPGVPGQPVIRLHPESVQLSAASHLRRVHTRRLLGQN